MSKKGSIFALLLSGRAMESRRMRNKIATNEKQNRGGDVRPSRPTTITTTIRPKTIMSSSLSGIFKIK